MELTDIVSKEEWEAFEKDIFERFEINATVYNASGISVTGKPNWCNRLCPEIKANKDSLAAICAPGNQNFMAQAKKGHRPVVGECDAGLIKICVPIFFDGDFLGTAGGCGLLPEGGEVETFMIEKSAGLSEQEIESLSRDIATLSESRAAEMVEFIEMRIRRYLERYAAASASSATGGRNEAEKVQHFLDAWRDDELAMKAVFTSLYQDLIDMEGADIAFNERPGISFSLRGIHPNDARRPLFVMIDVIDDDPKRRWLSVCFYGDMITDPEELGDLIPEGLLGDDGHCFDIDTPDPDIVTYVRARIQEAYADASESAGSAIEK